MVTLARSVAEPGRSAAGLGRYVAEVGRPVAWPVGRVAAADVGRLVVVGPPRALPTLALTLPCVVPACACVLLHA